jgi:hypothetical protein
MCASFSKQVQSSVSVMKISPMIFNTGVKMLVQKHQRPDEVLLAFEERTDSLKNRRLNMLSLIIGGDNGIKVRRKIENQRGQRKGQRAHAAVDAAVKNLKMAAGAFDDRVFRDVVHLLHQPARLTCHQFVHLLVQSPMVVGIVTMAIEFLELLRGGAGLFRDQLQWKKLGMRLAACAAAG